MLHADIAAQNTGGDPLEFLVVPDLHEAAQKLAAETMPLIRVADENGEFGFRRHMQFAQAPHRENAVLAALRILAVHDQRHLAVVSDKTTTRQALSQRRVERRQGERAVTKSLD